MDPPAADPPQSPTVATASPTAASAATTPRSAPPAANGADPVSAGAKRRPGRPPKPKPDPTQAPVPVFADPVSPGFRRGPGRPPKHGQPTSAAAAAAGVGGGVRRGRGRPKAAVAVRKMPVFAPQPPQNSDIGQLPVHVPVGPVNVPVGPVNVPVGPVNGTGRGRGRPPGRRGRGRPKAVIAVRKMATVGRPRGRPPKPINVVAAPSSAAAVITGKRRGRPPRADGEAKKPRNFSGKPLGRPKKNNDAPATRTPDSQLLVAYLDLKSKLELLQSKVKQTVTSIGPSLDNEAAITALHELEFEVMNVNAPTLIVQIQQPPQPQS